MKKSSEVDPRFPQGQRITLKARTMRLNRYVVEWLGNPETVEVVIDPESNTLIVTAHGQYILNPPADNGAVALNFPDAEFMKKGMYVPVTDQVNTYRWIADGWKKE